jgi:hypothetical protein
MERRPAARASAARDNVGFTEVFRPGSLKEIRSRIPEASLRVIDEIPGISWLEFEHDRWLMDSTIAVLGREDAIQCWRQSLVQLVEKPLLKNFVSGALRLFGGRPGKLVKMVPKGWTLAYRDFCVPRFVAIDDHACELHFDDIAPQAFESEGYIHCWHAVCLGIFDIEKAKDPVIDFEIDRKNARAIARFGWA